MTLSSFELEQLVRALPSISNAGSYMIYPTYLFITTMPKKHNSLQGFLRDEVLKNRIRPPSPPPPSERTTPPLVSSEDIPASDADRLFGESICIPDKEHPHKEQLLSSQLKQLLSQPTFTTAPPRAPTLVKPALQDLREELKSLVYAEEEAGSREMQLVRRQRVALLNEIGWVEAEERRVREEEWKGELIVFFLYIIDHHSTTIVRAADRE
jgi:hypothetical protein